MTGAGPKELTQEHAAQVGALQAALAAENAAVYGYGVAGAHLTGRLLSRAQRDWDGHQTTRDDIAAMVTARGARPAAAATVYGLPFPVHDARTAVALAAYLEDRVAGAYMGLVALSDPALRAFGARSVASAALRAALWRGHTVAFPGLANAASPGPELP